MNKLWSIYTTEYSSVIKRNNLVHAHVKLFSKVIVFNLYPYQHRMRNFKVLYNCHIWYFYIYVTLVAKILKTIAMIQE